MDDSTVPDLLPAVRELGDADGAVHPHESLLVGFSGGADSVALLDLLHRLAPSGELRVIAAHLDHGLRPVSGEDALFCARFCADRGIPLRTHKIQVDELPERKHVGLEGAAREARHRWLEQVRQSEGCDRIALAHHLDDHVETLLLWMLRGTGLSGMRGIPAARGVLVRPLRSFSRERIRDYLAWRGLPWREDETNAQAVGQRNRLRNEVFPLLSDVFDAGVPQRLADFARRVTADLEALELLAEQALTRSRAQRVETGWKVDRDRFRQEPQSLQFYMLRRMLVDAPDMVQSQRWNEPAFLRVLAFARQARTGAKMPLPGGGWLRVDRDTVWLDLTP